jgi:hypothetical protein
MYALLLAGGIPGEDDPLFPLTQGKPKALYPLAGKAMGQWVLDALGEAKNIEGVVAIGAQELQSLHCRKPTYFIPDAGSMLTNAYTGLQYIAQLLPKHTHALVVPCDIPAVKPEMIDWRLSNPPAPQIDLDYLVAERGVMEARFPGAARSYVRLKDVEVCGGDALFVRLAISSEEKVWTRLIAARKSPLRQAALIGIDTLLLVMTRRITLAQAEQLVSKRLGLAGKVTLSPYAELAMDVDKPIHVEAMNKVLSAG